MSNLPRFGLMLLLLLLHAVLPAAVAQAAAVVASPADLIAGVQKRYGQLHSLEFDFAQVTLTSGRSREGRGQAVFYRPARATGATKEDHGGVIRWNYAEPTEQTIINDGREVSIYTPRDKQLLVTPASEMEADVTYSMFTGARGLQDEFEASPADPLFLLTPSQAGTTAVQLTPRRSQSQVKRIQLWLDGSQGIQRILMEDHFGAFTELTFTNIRFNGLRPDDPGQAQALRRLDLAPGTETIRQ